MVSLSRGTNNLEGGENFVGGSEEPEPDVQCLLQPVVGQEKLRHFTPLKTVIPAAILLILAIVMEIMVLTFAFTWDKNEKKCEPYFITLYSHVVYWSFSFIIHFHLRKKHNESRLRGYLELYQKTHNHSQIPFYITSLWNTLLLLVATLFHDQYNDLESRCESHGFLSPINYMCFIITLENVFMIPTIILYIFKVSTFNKSRMYPDVQRDEWMSSFIQNSYSAGEVGYREQDNHIEDLLEKQADLLRYFKEQNSVLLGKVLLLNSMLLRSQPESLQC